MAKLGFVGLGTMGAPMAGHLIAAGHEVTVWNRTRAKAETLVAKGATLAASLAELARESRTIIFCVSRTEDLEACLAEVTPFARVGTLLIDHSTIAPTAAAQIHNRLFDLGLRFMDAPITGGSMGAQNGTLTIFCGGKEVDFKEAAPILAAYAKRAEYVGPAGSGQMMKMANQIAVAGSLLGLSEALAFASRAGLDLTQTHELLSGGAAGSWAFNNYGPKILNRDWTPGFSVTNQIKDLVYAGEAADALGANIPGARLVEDLLGLLVSQGRGQDTTAALFDVLVEPLPTTRTPDPAPATPETETKDVEPESDQPKIQEDTGEAP